MTQAAERLHMTQPSVSQAISELEEHYHVRLFERLNRRLFITAAGEKLLTYARHIVNLNNQAESAMQEFYSICHIRAGASLTIGETVFAAVLQKLKCCYPKSRLTSVVKNTAVLEKMLLADDIDIALIEGEVESEYLYRLPFMEDELIFVAGRENPLAEKKSVSLAEITECEFLLREEGSGTRALFEHNMHSLGLKPKLCGVYSNSAALKQAVRANLGITVISEKSVHGEIASGELKKLTVEGISFKRFFSIVYHKNKYISQEMQKLMDICREFS
jgi:DNA-binding transcriptional LysR family regulator